MSGSWRARAASGALIVLVHLVACVFLVRHTGTPSGRDAQPPAVYIALGLIPQTVKPKPAEATIVPPPRLPRKRAVTAGKDDPPPSAVIVPADRVAQEESSEQAAAPAVRIDMDALRSAARRVEQERVPTALEKLRESEQMRSEDDDPLVRGIQRSKRPTCQTAYAGGEKLNLIMLIPLALDTIRDKGCKW